jgi:pectin methylesterase-like acyl-CoA thioesterase
MVVVALLSAGACSSTNARAPGVTGGAPGSGGADAPSGSGGGPAGTGGMPPGPAPALLGVLSGRFPAADSKEICADTQLRLTFTVPVAIGQSGKIQVWKASAPAAPIDTVDAGVAVTEDMIGGRHFYQNRPIFIDGMQAIIYLHRAAPLAPNETYYVTVDSGVFTDPAGATLGEITSSTDWRFTTRATMIPAALDSLVVALDNTGDFCSVQGAIDAIPAANATPVKVTLKNGTYREIVFINGKNQITLHGQERKSTIIAYANNNTLQSQAPAVGGTANRAMVEVEKSNDLTIENLTLHNLTPQGGSQAEAIRIEPGDRAILRDADVLSLQDTILISGRAYVTNCYVEGNTDFIWGKGTVYFDKCEIKAVGKKGYNVQARNATNAYGYVFVDSKLTSSPNLTGHLLARVDGTAYPGSHVAYINCEMGSHIDPTGWLLTNPPADTSLLRYWEYMSVDPTGAPVDVSKRIAASKQLTADEAAMMRDKATVFGLPAWNPTP